MASFKKLDHRSKLMPAKEKVGIGKIRFGKENSTRTSVGATSFKVYSEKETAKADAVRRVSVPVNKVSTEENTIALKAGLKSMEKRKGILGSSVVNTNLGRRALADVSNMKSNSSQIVVGNASKTMNGKSEKTKALQRISVGSGIRIVNVSSRRSSLGKGRENPSQDFSKLQTSKRAIKNLKAPLDNQRTKAMGLTRESIVTDGRPQSNSNARPLPRNSVRVNVKSSLKTLNSQKTLKSKSAVGPKKLVSAAASSSNNDSVVESSLLENVKHEALEGKLPSDGNYNQSTSSIIARKNAKRRRSYTSILMNGSKLLADSVEAMKQEELPSIDDGCNQLEVSDYVDEIYQYYWVSEAQNPPLGNFMVIQADITPQMRGILVNWLIEVHFKFDLMQETLYLMVILLDQYLSQVRIKKDDMQLVGLAALLLASKYEDFWHPKVKDLISISAESYTRAQVLGMEKLILKKLKFRLNSPTPYVFMLRFLKAAQSEPKLEHLSFYLIELCLVEYEALRFKPSLLCAAALYVARCTLQITPAWTPLISKHTRYEVSQIRDCAEMILRFQKAAKAGLLMVTYEKYISPDLSGVAAIKPLERLPF